MILLDKHRSTLTHAYKLRAWLAQPHDTFELLRLSAGVAKRSYYYFSISGLR